MFRKKLPFHIIFDNTLSKKKRRLKVWRRFFYLIIILMGLYFSQSIFLLGLIIFLNRIVIEPKFNHQIQYYSESFTYIYKTEVTSVDYGEVAFIDQDVFELNGELYYNKLTLLNEQFDKILEIKGRYFGYDELVNFCQYIQNTNLSSRENYYNQNERFLESVKAIDDLGIID